jgi:hypothetical protein
MFWWVFAISLAYWFCAGMRATQIPFWSDEIETIHIARMPSIDAMWTANRSGIDNNILLSHILVRISETVLGTGYFAIRLPAIAGVWIMTVCMFLFLRRRLPGPYSLIGMMFPMFTLAWRYALEARAYGPVLGFAGLALIAWQRASELDRASAWLPLITMSLAGALLCHPYAVLLAIPFAFGEVVRSVGRRRIDWKMWIAFAAAAPVVLLYPAVFAPMKSISLKGVQPGLSVIPLFYSEVFGPAIWPLVLAGGLAVAFWLVGKMPVGDPHAREVFLPVHEVAVLSGFALAPVFLLICIVLSNGLVYFPRYGLICIIGVSGFVTLALYRCLGGNQFGAKIILAVFILWFVGSRGRFVLRGLGDPTAEYQRTHPLLYQAASDGRPVLVESGITIMEAEFYLPDAGARRLHYATWDPVLRREYPWQDMADQLTTFATRLIPKRFKLTTWSEFAADTTSFLLHVDGTEGGEIVYWIPMRGGWNLRLVAHEGGEALYEVTRQGIR